MLKGIYTAASGMTYQMDALTEVTSNLANVNTSGHKRTQLVAEAFDGLVFQFANPTAQNTGGAGVRSGGVARFDSQGPLSRTSNPLHMALSGDGYFQTVNARGAVQVTRNGDFRLDEEGYLTSQSGDRVLSTANTPILLGQVASEELVIRKDGTVTAGGNPIAQLKVVSPIEANPVTFPASNVNAPSITEGYSVEQGYLENSNVNVVTEMVNMITINKAFTFGQKAITIQDNLLNKTVNDLGRVQ